MTFFALATALAMIVNASWKDRLLLVASAIPIAILAGLLAYEHAIVRPTDLRRLDMAFFTMNGVIGVAFFGFVLVDALVS